MPFILFPRQREWLEFTVQNWRDGKPGLTEKSRDMGVSWLSMALSCTLCLFYENMRIGFGLTKSARTARLVSWAATASDIGIGDVAVDSVAAIRATHLQSARKCQC
jgi:hypothetical protein